MKGERKNNNTAEVPFATMDFSRRKSMWDTLPVDLHCLSSSFALSDDDFFGSQSSSYRRSRTVLLPCLRLVAALSICLPVCHNERINPLSYSSSMPHSSFYLRPRPSSSTFSFLILSSSSTLYLSLLPHLICLSSFGSFLTPETNYFSSLLFHFNCSPILLPLPCFYKFEGKGRCV